MKCLAKHTQYQPSDAEWSCPKCGANVRDTDGFFIDESGEGKSDDCGALHKDDVLVCYRCSHHEQGAVLARRCAKTAGMVPCPNCKGHGLVDAKKVKP